MKFPWTRLLALTLLVFSSLISAQPMMPQTDPGAVSKALIDHLQAGDFEAATKNFTPEMLAAVPADKLQMTWSSLPEQLGELQRIGTPEISSKGDVTEVVTPLEFARMKLVSRVVVDASGRVSGFLIQPAPPEAAPAVSSAAAFDETEMSFGPSGRELPATLAMPKGAGPFPGVVLVHGSGPHDRDETIGPNRPFLDIARGLAAKGIAVLRYEKRTRARPQDFASAELDMDDETTNDAVLAVAALAAVSGIDSQRIYVLGHSQGGMLAPRIALHAKGAPVAGLILMAAPARSLLDLLPEQYRYLFMLDGKIAPEEQAAIDQLKTQIANVRSAGEFAAEQLPLGMSTRYWRTFEKVDPVADARAAGLPMLILQGDRDFQVVEADIARWQQAFGDSDHVSIIRYPTLSHLFMPGEGPGKPDEYQTPAHVDPKVTDDIVHWVSAQQ